MHEAFQRRRDARALWTAVLWITALPLAVACGGPRHGGVNLSEAQVAERFEDIAEYGLDYVDADEAQTEQVSQVIRGLAPDLVRFRSEQRALSAQLRAELAKDPVDRAQIEALRRRAVELFDQASARGSQALTSAADVLTPEQRQKLTQKWEKYAR